MPPKAATSGYKISRFCLLTYRDIGSAEHRKEKSRSESFVEPEPDGVINDIWPVSWARVAGFLGRMRGRVA